jgi:predicted outer membrane repeat protein
MRTLGFCSGILAGAAGFAHASVCFVDGNAAGANDGSSWASAYLDLQSALVSAACGEIWVAAFVYKPANSNASFNIAPGTAVYGGFSGTETLRDQRNPAAHLTVLSGDIDNNDCAGLCVGGVTADATQIVGVNAHRVVVMDGTGTPITSSTVLDGFTITAGDADPSGGGLFCDGEGAGKACSPTLANLVFSGNRASAVGGAIFCYADSGGVCSPVLSNAVFRGNHAEGQGGAIYCDGENGSTCNPTLTDVTFESNSAGQWGGAMYDDGLNGASSPVLNRVAFVANDAVYGGAMYNEGTGGASNPTLTNVTFSGNTASRGGAMLNDAQSGGSASPIVTNATFAGNHASAYGGAINSYDVGGTSNPLLTNVILWGNTATLGSPVTIGNATIAYAMVEGGCPAGNSCSHLVAGDPRLGPLRDNGGATRTLDLGSGSAAIDAGSDAACPAQDQRGVTRPQGLHCDIGAVETDRVFADNFDGTPVP